MAQMQFTDDLKLDFARIDEIHQEFVETYNALEAANPEQDLPAFLAAYDGFIAHLEAHFGEENRWMAAVGFPECHKGEHDRVLVVVHDVRKRAEAGDFNLAKRLIHELPLWLDNHAKSMDTALARYLQEIGFDPATLSTPEPQGECPPGRCSC